MSRPAETDHSLTRALERAYDAAPLKGEFVQAVRSHPLVIASCSSRDPWMDGYVECHFKLRPEVPLWRVGLRTAQSHDELLVSDTDALAEFVQKLTESYRQVDRPASPRVLAKMVALRMRGLREAYETRARAVPIEREELLRRMSSTDDMDVLTGDANRLASARLALPPPEPEPQTAPGLLEWIRRCQEAQVPFDFTELQNVLLRSDVTDEAVKDALDQYTVSRIIHS